MATMVGTVALTAGLSWGQKIMASLSWGQKSNGRCFSYNTDVAHGVSISGLVLGMDGIVKPRKGKYRAHYGAFIINVYGGKAEHNATTASAFL